MATMVAARPSRAALGRSVRGAVRLFGLPLLQVVFGIGLVALVQLDDRRPLYTVVIAIVVIAISWHVRNLTDLRRRVNDERVTAHRLAEAEAQIRDLVERLPAAVYRDRYSAEDGRFLAVEYVSPHMEALTGYPTNAFATDGALWTRLVHPDDRARVFAINVRDSVDSGIDHEYRIIRRDGEVIWVHEDARVLAVPGADTILSHGLLTDITDRKRLEHQLSQLAFHDPLTGLANRSLFEDRLEHALADKRRTATTAVLFLDLDGFKSINDSLGHQAGDRMLGIVAGRLLAHVRPADTVARLGGDEFGVLLDDVDEPSVASAAAERLLAALAAPFEVNGRQLAARASIGIAIAGAHGSSAEELLRDADAAMYRAKAQRKGSWVMFEPAMHADAVARFDLEADLRRALEREELYLAYQPIHSFGSERTEGAEVLLRWTHPQRGSIPPSVFIPIAEESDLIVELGRWVLTNACRQVARWRDRGLVDAAFSISVNVSARQLTAELPPLIENLLTETGLPARNLTIEVTESAVMRDTAAAIDTLWTIRGMGVSVAMDDFGTGYSSLSHLRALPIDAVKIDRSFVSGVDRPVEAQMIKAVVELASVLWLRTVAEGVETAEQAAALAALGCDFGQGYFFGKPVAPEFFLRLRPTRTSPGAPAQSVA